jgi:cytochrome c peroxidase
MQMNTSLKGVLPTNFTLDRVVLSTGNVVPDAVAAAGSVSVFQKIFFRRFTLIDDSTRKVLFQETTRAPAFASIVPDIRREQSSSSSNVLAVDRLISRGAQLFFENKFGGNGRTCGTCHPKENNFSLDRTFIASLPKNNPLFVAEFNPALAQLERPKLMRQFGLILENLDGVEDPANKFVMRGVSHTLGMGTGLAQDKTQPNPPAQMTGWSGDGAPGAGSLRDFATGAVTQHLPRSLNRVAGVDFTLPNELQLDAMEAFQLSLGREKDFVLTAIRFNDANVENGKQIFLNGTGDPNAGNRCTVCHGNAGALAINGQNGNFNTRVEDAMHPAQSVQPFPKDGGFGQGLNATGTFGNNTFNTSSVVEAADTPPFFHNNLVNTLEEVVDFYAGPEFNKDVPPAGQFSFTPQQTSDIANFMRGINTLQNIDVAVRELRLTLNLPSSSSQDVVEIGRRLAVANLDVRDGTTVLQQGKIYPTAVTQLSAARQSIERARRSSTSDRRALTQRAISQLTKARQIIAT